MHPWAVLCCADSVYRCFHVSLAKCLLSTEHVNDQPRWTASLPQRAACECSCWDKTGDRQKTDKEEKSGVCQEKEARWWRVNHWMLFLLHHMSESYWCMLTCRSGFVQHIPQKYISTASHWYSHTVTTYLSVQKPSISKSMDLNCVYYDNIAQALYEYTILPPVLHAWVSDCFMTKGDKVIPILVKPFKWHCGHLSHYVVRSCEL